MEPSNPFKADKIVNKGLYALADGFMPTRSQNLGSNAGSICKAPNRWSL
jgi:hypothetical protein